MYFNAKYLNSFQKYKQYDMILNELLINYLRSNNSKEVSQIYYKTNERETL